MINPYYWLPITCRSTYESWVHNLIDREHLLVFCDWLEEKGKYELVQKIRKIEVEEKNDSWLWYHCLKYILWDYCPECKYGSHGAPDKYGNYQITDKNTVWIQYSEWVMFTFYNGKTRYDKKDLVCSNCMGRGWIIVPLERWD